MEKYEGNMKEYEEIYIYEKYEGIPFTKYIDSRTWKNSEISHSIQALGLGKIGSLPFLYKF